LHTKTGHSLSKYCSICMAKNINTGDAIDILAHTDGF
jgi:hypothetical protein